MSEASFFLFVTFVGVSEGRTTDDAGKGKLAGGEGRVDYYEGHSLQTAVRSTAFRRFGHSGMSILPLKSGEMDSAAPDHN